jgi:hypothetical protein
MGKRDFKPHADAVDTANGHSYELRAGKLMLRGSRF